MDFIFKAFAVAAGLFAVVVLIAVILALPFMWLWNWLCPEIFGLQKIGFWQSLGLLIMSGFIFKSSSSSK